MNGLKILAIESSAVCASAAVSENGKIVSECFVNAGLTHSQTLLPMVKSCLDTAKLTIDDIDVIAAAVGPGSFTGVRIGVATAKGLAFGGKECRAVSTLEGMAYNFLGVPCSVCCVMDARCSQVYTAAFACGETVTRLCEDKAVLVSELPEMLTNLKKPVYLLGDGADLCYNYLKSVEADVLLAPPHLKYQRASGVALAAEHSAGQVCDGGSIQPVYLRVPQAERELKKRKTERERNS